MAEIWTGPIPHEIAPVNSAPPTPNHQTSAKSSPSDTAHGGDVVLVHHFLTGLGFLFGVDLQGLQQLPDGELGGMGSGCTRTSRGQGE